MKSKLYHFVILQRFELQDSRSSVLPKEIKRVERVTEHHVSRASVIVRTAEKEITIKVMSQGLCFLRRAFFCPFWPALGLWSPCNFWLHSVMPIYLYLYLSVYPYMFVNWKSSGETGIAFYQKSKLTSGKIKSNQVLNKAFCILSPWQEIVFSNIF